MAANKRPAILFYTGDWLRDAALRSCSIGARGMWVDMICYMHDCQPYGYLKVNHKVILISNLSSMIGLTLEDGERYLQELLDAGVCAKKEDGTIYSARMIRDEEIRLKRATGGGKGGNPDLKKKKKRKGYPSLEDEDDNENESKDEKESIVMPFESENFFSMWAQWKAYKKQEHKFTYKTLQTEQAALMKLTELAGGEEIKAIAVIRESMAQGWKGFFELKNNNGNEQRNSGRGNGQVLNAGAKAELARRMGFDQSNSH